VYHLAQTIAPAVVILEDLDLMTKSRDNPYAFAVKDDVTGELLQVLSGGSAYSDIITIATTNHPEAIDQALAKRAGRFDAHIRMGYRATPTRKTFYICISTASPSKTTSRDIDFNKS
jgi:SpoVK/Ycf46/Vps4 family AAA+-type ATPase